MRKIIVFVVASCLIIFAYSISGAEPLKIKPSGSAAQMNLQKTNQLKNNISVNSSETHRFCPDSLLIDNIPTEPQDLDGFIGVPLGNIPAKFTFSKVGRSSSTDCYCEYKLGDLKARIKADMTGYGSCTVGYIPKPGTNAQVEGIILYK